MSGEYTILIDSREKKPYKFPGVESRFEQLNVGDYTIDGFQDEFAVERKTLDDLTRSMGTDRERFENEMIRAVDGGMENLEVVIEAPRWHVYNYGGTGHSPKYYSDIIPNSIIGTVEKWPGKYPPLNFTWADTRDKAQSETLRLLDSWYIKRVVDK